LIEQGYEVKTCVNLSGIGKVNSIVGHCIHIFESSSLAMTKTTEELYIDHVPACFR